MKEIWEQLKFMGPDLLIGLSFPVGIGIMLWYANNWE